jgi:hypothetical protein
MTIHDSVSHPNYYVLPNGAEVIDITQWLNAAGSQSVQFIVRSTRIDGVVKENQLEDIRKAVYWLGVEEQRLLSLSR